MQSLIFATTVGMERVAARELRRSIATEPRVAAPGRLVVPPVSALQPLIARLNRDLRGIDRLGILIGSATVMSLPRIRALTAALEWERLIDPGASLAVRGLRVGRHEFRSQQIASEVGAGVIDRLGATMGRRPRVSLRNPDQPVRAELFGEDLLLWLDTTGDAGLHQRAYRQYAHMASMRPTFANLLLELAEWRDETLIDPFCGSGTLLIEAAHRALGTPPGALRGQGWAWQRIPALAGGEPIPAAARVSGPACTIGRPVPVLVGIERFGKHLRGAAGNIEAAGLTDRIRLVQGLAEQTDRILGEAAGSGAIVVTNPPFGRRVGTKRQIRRLYQGAARAWWAAGVQRVVAPAEDGAGLRQALTSVGYRIQTELRVVYGRIPIRVLLGRR